MSRSLVLAAAALAAATVTAAAGPRVPASSLSPLHKWFATAWSAGRADAGVDAHPPLVFGHFAKHAMTAATALAAHARRGARMAGRSISASRSFAQPSVHDTLGHSYFPDNGDGFYAVLPEFITAAVPGQVATWSSACLTSNVATATWSADGTSLNLNITSSGLNSSAPLCSDLYLIGTVDAIDLVQVSAAGSQSVAVPVARKTWATREGVRIFRFIHDPLTTIGDAVATLSLFVPSLIEPTLDPASQAANAKFLKDYVGIDMPPRAAGTIAMDWDYVQSGDILVIQRLDGLGTMEQWGTGAASTHIVMALRLGDGKLYIAESTAKDAYWPLDNIQVNAIETWLPMAEASAYAVVHLPLSDAARATWNQSAAEEFVFDNVGYPYGYHNFIMTFFDDPAGVGNLPWPASWQLVEIVFNLLETVDANLTNQLLGEGLNMRLGTTGLDLAQCADEAAARNLTVAALIALPEQDGWVYSDGPSMVCDVFFCNVHKAAGTFGDPAGPLAQSINCREFHNLDVYRLNIFNVSSPRPAVCVASDPDLPYCQIMGAFTLNLTNINSYEPYAHMNENCIAMPLQYQRMPTFQC